MALYGLIFGPGTTTLIVISCWRPWPIEHNIGMKRLVWILPKPTVYDKVCKYSAYHISLNNARDPCGIQLENSITLRFKAGFVIQTFPKFDIPQTCLSLHCGSSAAVASGRLNHFFCFCFLSFAKPDKHADQGYIYIKPVQFPPSSIHTTKECFFFFLWLLYIYNMTSSLFLFFFFELELFGLSSFSLPVRCFFCVRWVLLVVFCMHVLYCLPSPRPSPDLPHPFSSIFFFLITVPLAAQPALHVASGHTPGPTNALELGSLCPNQRSGDIHFYFPIQSHIVLVNWVCAQSG